MDIEKRLKELKKERKEEEKTLKLKEEEIKKLEKNKAKVNVIKEKKKQYEIKLNKYEKLLLEIKKIESEVIEKKKEDLERFDYDLMGNIIARLISEIEGQNFKFKNITITDYTWTNVKKYKTIINDDLLKISHVKDHENTIIKYDLLMKDNMIIFDNNNELGKCNNMVDKRKNTIYFYDKENNPTVVVKRFTYVYDFINKLTEYKKENNINILTKEDYEIVLYTFIKEYRNSMLIKK